MYMCCTNTRSTSPPESRPDLDRSARGNAPGGSQGSLAPVEKQERERAHKSGAVRREGRRVLYHPKKKKSP